MKKKEVPQDDEGLMEGKLRDLCYAVDENGKYVQVYSTGWEPKNAAMKQAWEEINKKVEATKRDVLKGRLSPVAYFMEKNIMDTSILAQYLEITKRRVRKHMKPKIFQKLDPGMLKKYAETFGITIDELLTLNEPESKE